MTRRVLLASAIVLLTGCDVVLDNSGPTDSRGVELDDDVQASDCYTLTERLARGQEASSSGLIGARGGHPCDEVRAEGRVGERAPRGTAFGPRSRTTTGQRQRGFEEWGADGAGAVVDTPREPAGGRDVAPDGAETKTPAPEPLEPARGAEERRGRSPPERGAAPGGG